MVVNVPPKVTSVEVAYGFPPGAYAPGDGDRTDGATFQVEWQCDGQSVMLLNLLVHPADEPAHRPLQHFRADLPVAPSDRARLIFRTLPGPTATKDWTCWSRPEFH